MSTVSPSQSSVPKLAVGVLLGVSILTFLSLRPRLTKPLELASCASETLSTVVVEVDDAGGVERDARVYLQGVQIGWVDRVELTGDSRVRLDLRVCEERVGALEGVVVNCGNNGLFLPAVWLEVPAR